MEAEHTMDSNPLPHRSIRYSQSAKLLPDRWRIIRRSALRHFHVYHRALVPRFGAADSRWKCIRNEEGSVATSRQSQLHPQT